jgi:hypothetical protein
MSDLSRRQSILAGLGVVGAVVTPAALFPEDARATALGRPPEPEWSMAFGFDMDAEVANVRAAVERCAKAGEACDRCVAAQYARPTDDEAAWDVENERLFVEARVVEDEFMAATRNFHAVKAGFDHRPLASLGIADVFDF